MIWQPRSLQLNTIKPAQAKAGEVLPNVSATGTGFVPGVRLMLIRSGDYDGLTPADIIPCNDARIVEGNFQLSFSLNLDGVTPGRYDAVAWNPPLREGDASERYVLETAFTVA
jgi:hypothetical protein